jgi:phosphoglycolate phosphatase
MPYDAVIFDLDGTLLDTLDDLADSANAVLAREGFAMHEVFAYRHFVGDGVVELMRRALPEDRRSDEVLLERVVSGMREEYAGRWDVKTQPYPGVAELLGELAGRGMKTAVLSNKPHDFTLLCVEKLLSGWRFDAVQGVADGVPPKPDPAGGTRVMEAMGVAPDRCLYVGDTDTDMHTARALGLASAGVTWGFRDEPELRQAGATYIIHHPLEAIVLL